jgi:hypothetical protein
MKDKQRRLLQWIKNQNCSIVFLQETHFNNESKCLVKRLLSTETSNWKVIPRNYLDKVGKNWLIFKMNIDNGLCRSHTAGYYQSSFYKLNFYY